MNHLKELLANAGILGASPSQRSSPPALSASLDPRVVEAWLEPCLVTPPPEELCLEGGPGGRLLYELEALEEQQEGSGTLLGAMDSTKTVGGRRVLRHVLSTPINDAAVLRLRQKALRRMRGAYAKGTEQADELLTTMRRTEHAMSWFLSKRSKEEEEVLNMVYFSRRLTRPLNNNKVALQAHAAYKLFVCPSVGLLSPIIYFVIPYIILRIRFKMQASFLEYLKLLYRSTTMVSGHTASVSYLFSLVFYFQGVFSAFEVANTVKRIVGMISQRYSDFFDFLDAATRLNTLFQASCDPGLFCMAELDAAVDLGHLRLPRRVPPSKIGDLLYGFRAVDVNAVQGTIASAYLVDALLSALRAVAAQGMCFVEYDVRSKTPLLHMERAWHPCLKAPVRNGLRLGGAAPRNVIITGPNAGGKSTFVKSVMVNQLLAHTLTVAAAERMVTSVFARLCTQLNVPDAKGRESLFEAEMHRCKEKIEMIEQLGGKQCASDAFVLLAVDEMFSSTEPLEGLAAAYAIAHTLALYPNVSMLITTHYKYMCNLATEADFANYKMTAVMDDGKITFPYRLQKGASDQTIALELLQHKGFARAITEKAIRIRERLLSAGALPLTPVPHSSALTSSDEK